MAGFELLEHTADIGLRAHGATLEEVFEQATLALAEVLGVSRPEGGEDAGEEVSLEVAAEDLGGLLVDWLNEVLYLHEVRAAAVAGVRVDTVADHRAAGALTLGPGTAPEEGTVVKAATYHRLRVKRVAGGFLAEVYLDV